MFRPYSYYKHINGRDAVIFISEVQMTTTGYMVKAAWCVLDYHGQPYPPAIVRDHFISTEDAQDWNLYEVPE